MKQDEVQNDLERLTGDLITRLGDAVSDLNVLSQSPELRYTALRQLLLYETSALDIATGPMPEVAFCDMAVFVVLCRGVFERHWLKVFGEGARPILTIWEDAEERLHNLTSTAITPKQADRLRVLVKEWLDANPDRIDVESVRFSEFSTLVGKIAAERADETKGIFGSVKSATTAADQALLLADRLRFLAMRLPFVLRLHARLAAYELVSDASGHVHQLEKIVTKLPDTLPITENLSTMTASAADATHEARSLLQEVKPLLDRVASLVPKDAQGLRTTLETTGKQLDRFARRGVVYLVALGAAWSLLMWGGYVAAKRRAHRYA